MIKVKIIFFYYIKAFHDFFSSVNPKIFNSTGLKETLTLNSLKSKQSISVENRYKINVAVDPLHNTTKLLLFCGIVLWVNFHLGLTAIERMILVGFFHNF